MYLRNNYRRKHYIQRYFNKKGKNRYYIYEILIFNKYMYNYKNSSKDELKLKNIIF